jgi:hemolysin activation/secretion protein
VGLIALLLLAPAAGAQVPERRRDYESRRPNEYLIVPAVASLPGIGVFAGVISSATNLGDTGIDAAATLAHSIDNTDIDVQFLVVRNIPIVDRHLTLEYWTGHLRLGNFQAYLPGRNSPNFTIPVTAEFNYQLVRPVLRFWERRINLSYSLFYFDGFNFDQNGNEQPNARNGASADFLLDLTDDVVNATRGVRFHYNTSLRAPSETFFGRDRTPAGVVDSNDVTVENYEVTGYLPLSARLGLVLDAQFFQARGQESRGEVIAGGSPPLRGYPGGRWSDRYGVFGAAELRYTFPTDYDLDIYLARGIVEGIQLALFTDAGQVSPKNDSKLFTDLHHSYGVGVRALFEAIVLRLDLATSDEGLQTHLTIDQPF